MTRKRAVQKAMLTSFISLVLCVVMLMGSTFAWFTDSVVVASNHVMSGTLTMDVKYSEDMVSWMSVDETTQLFDENDGWEPGHTRIVYFRIKNTGNLAFQYQAGLHLIKNTIGKSVNGSDLDLTKYLKFDLIDVETAFTDRESARAAVKNEKDFGDYSQTVELFLPEETVTKALVVYMPENVTNEAMHDGDKAPRIEFGIEFVAAQTPYEKDSFDENYDKNPR